MVLHKQNLKDDLLLNFKASFGKERSMLFIQIYLSTFPSFNYLDKVVYIFKLHEPVNAPTVRRICFICFSSQTVPFKTLCN